MATKKPKKKRKGTRRTGDRVATIAGKWLANMRGVRGGVVVIRASELRALCTSCLVQDEVKGPRQ
jgi:hypothetical protein